MNQVTRNNADAKSLDKESMINFSVAAGSLWITRHLLLGMLFYFVIGQIPGIMLKADLFRCVGISLLLSMVVFLAVTGLTLLGSLLYVTYRLFKNPEEFLQNSEAPKLEWMSDQKYAPLYFVFGIIFNTVLLKAFSSFYPNLIMLDGWLPSLSAACIIVIVNRSLHSLQKNVVKLSLGDEAKTAHGRV